MTVFIIFEYDFLKNEITDQKLFANNQQNSDVFNFPNKIGGRVVKKMAIFPYFM